TTFMDHVLRYEDTPGIKMIVVLGEVSVTLGMPPIRLFVTAYHFHICSLTQIGGTDEYKICQGIKEGRITKPVVLPRYACQFIEMCLMVTADHGPAVSGAHNTIVCARAGKDLISSLTSGLLTIVSTTHTQTGDRFGGALDAAAKQFSKAFDSGMLPMEFVNKMKKDGKLIMGIGHRVKSVSSFSF
ncbi:hypothetical protein XENOCAPTIV_002391, partial [Xenoophorus captivus]